jgi:hypothetical protein
MNYLIHKVLAEIKSSNEDIRSNAITNISLILEMNSWKFPLERRMSKYDRLIKQELMNINLTESEETKIVDFLQTEVVNCNKSTHNLLFAIGKASSKAGLIPLLDIIQNNSCNFDENDSYQALIALERLLFWDEELSAEDKKNIIYQNNPKPFIEAKLALGLDNPSSPYSSGLQDTAKRLLDGLNELLEKS